MANIAVVSQIVTRGAVAARIGIASAGIPTHIFPTTVKPARSAVARKRVDGVDADSAVSTWIRQTLVDLPLAVVSLVSRRTHTHVVVQAVDAGAVVPTRIQVTAVRFRAVGAEETGKALARERVDAVDARSAVLARIVGAVVDVGLAQVALEAQRTLADTIRALAAVPTRIWIASRQLT